MSEEFVILLGDETPPEQLECEDQPGSEFVILLDDAPAKADGWMKLSARENVERAAELKDLLLSRMDSRADIELDASGVRSIDTAAFQLLTAAALAAKAGGSVFHIRGPSADFLQAAKGLDFDSSLQSAYV